MAAEALLGLITIVALVCLWYGPWQEICTDQARQTVFEKRDAIFDLAADGKLNFNSREYRQIRSSLERSIRFAHELTFPRLIVLSLAIKQDPQHSSGLKQAIRQIEDLETRQRVERLVFEAQRALVFMMFLKSPLAMLLLPLVLIGAVASYLIQAFNRALMTKVSKLGELIQVEAERAPSAALKVA